jgi:hypothetical protein
VDQQAVTIQVDDRSTALPTRDGQAAGDCGLDVVGRLARTWGFYRILDGWRVWAVLTPADVADGSFLDGHTAALSSWNG